MAEPPRTPPGSTRWPPLPPCGQCRSVRRMAIALRKTGCREVRCKLTEKLPDIFYPLEAFGQKREESDKSKVRKALRFTN
uniref:Uncharacterized protein n=1 Tax=Rangifer tarandus platyrhynchus TaxID=3082113 RepID=A0ACB0E5V0_RANTA|nr:unnamed protein product [Rangifer tarandus platyrhynchus]